MKGILAILLLPLLLYCNKALAQPNILLLHSYNHSYQWTLDIGNAMEEVLTRELPDAELFVEEMDSKRHSPTRLFPQLQKFLSEKYAGHRFDVLLCSDDNALDFLLTYGERLFPGTPVVFCGINSFDDKRLASHPNITGVVEAKDFSGTLEIALALHPATRQIALVSDRTPSGLANLKRIRDLIPRFEDRVDFVELIGLSTKELQHALRNLPVESIVLHLGYFQAGDGRYYTVAESNALISRNSRGPVYVFNDDKIQAGVIGGLVVSGRQQGVAAAELALRILRGEQPSDIPVARASPNVYMFDYRVLRRFGIDTDQLPQGTRLLHGPPAIDKGQRQKLIIALILATVFASLTVTLTIVLLQRRRTNKALRHSKGTLDAMLASIGDPDEHDGSGVEHPLVERQRQKFSANSQWARNVHEFFHQSNEPCAGPAWSGRLLTTARSMSSILP
ncbi:MAG: ABC transporter substrate binding protein [Syntrophotaleaceae bacterium]